MKAWTHLVMIPLLIVWGPLTSSYAAEASKDHNRPQGMRQKTAPNHQTSEAGAGDLASSLASLASKVKSIIAQPLCDRDADCQAIAFGAKPCGGPRSYLYYSKKTLDEANLKRLIEEYNALDKKHNQATGAISTCDIVEPTTPRCLETAGQKLCQAGDD